jgi:hypothetical protein
MGHRAWGMGQRAKSIGQRAGRLEDFKFIIRGNFSKFPFVLFKT